MTAPTATMADDLTLAQGGTAMPAADVPALPVIHWSEAWRRHAIALGAVWGIILLIFHHDTSDMVLQWWNSSTYNHCLLLVPIIGWLVHQRQEELSQLTPNAWWPGLLWSAGGGLLWLLGDLGGIALFRHAALIVMLQGAVISIMGLQVTRGLLFPLFYMFFLVPFGEELVPPMQTITAKLSMLFLGWQGIPAHIDGVFITTPNGYFEVAEACSGVKFLVAMAAYAVLVTNICFQSWTRRLIFLAFALIVPVIANGVRAYGTIAIAEKTGIEFAASFDHVMYGWFFFGAVMILVMGIGWRFFDRRVDDPMFDPADLAPTRFGRIKLPVAIAGVVALALIPFGWAQVTASPQDTMPKTISAPVVKGWTPIALIGGYPWKPRFDNADRLYLWRYRKDGSGEELDLAIAAFAGQHEGKELIGFGQGAMDPDSEWKWSENLGQIGGETGAAGQFDQYVAPGPVTRTAAVWYRIDGETLSSKTGMKLETLKQRLVVGDQRAAGVIISVERHAGQVQPEVLITDFLKSSPGVDAMANAALGK